MENNFKIKNIIGILVILLTAITALTSCGKGLDKSYNISQNPKPFKIRLAYFGELHELPLFAALERGFFKKDGIDAVLVKTDYDSFVEGLKSKTLDGGGCDFRIFQSIEKGLDVKLVAGIHGICTQIITSKQSSINSVRDLNGKTIGVEAIGNAPMVITSLLLKNNDIDPLNKVRWEVFNSTEKLKEALNEKRIDAIAILKSQNPNKANDGEKVIYSSLGASDTSHSHKGFEHFYAGFAGLRGDIVLNDDKKAFYITRAWLKAAEWVQTHQQEAIKLAVSKNYINGDLKKNESLAGYLMWSPGVRYAKKNIEVYIDEQIRLNLLGPGFIDKKPIDQIFVKVLPDFRG